MRILLWHVHGGWTDSFVMGGHDYLLPLAPDSGAIGRGGRDWPVNAIEVPATDLADTDFDVVVLQRPEDLVNCLELTGRRPGRDVAAVYLEHNTPKGAAAQSLHPLADQSQIPVVHVTHFNSYIWDNGRAPSIVIEHGIIDPGPLYTGERPSQAVVINEPVRRGRVAGTDLLPRFAEAGRVEAYGMGTDLLPEATGLGGRQLVVRGDLPTVALHQSLAGCRLYLHPFRWTSLGLALLEAMHLAMPVVVLDATEAARAVPPEAGAISTSVDELIRTSARLLADPDTAYARGRVAREAALARYGLHRFLSDWDTLLADVITRTPSRNGTKERSTR